ncbi:MAG: TIGR04255 family protein [Fuerstiella sp.]
MLETRRKMQLPHYDNPPVVETVVGMQFSPLPRFTNAYLGAFWQSLRPNDWPSVDDAPLLPMQAEQFAAKAEWSKALRLQFQLTQDPSSRIRITNSEQTRMVQLQNGRIHLNWLGRGGDAYPSYESVREEFESLLAHLIRFAGDEKLGTIVPDQWEVTYVNHIPKGSIWGQPCDWSFFQPLNAVPSIEGLIEAESFGGEWHFVIPEERGRLHVNWQHTKQDDPENSELVRLGLTARGPVDGNDKTSVLTGIDLGHKTIVCAFSKLMSDEANSKWGLNNGADD